MKMRVKTRLFAFALCAIGAPAFAAPPAGFMERAEAIRAAAGVPGMSIAIVEKGAPTLSQGFGVRKLGESAPVDSGTIFPTGSTGKAFTAAALAQLADQGKLKWDDPVIDHMPWFRMHDPWVTREITVRDLLVHRSGLGLGAGDLLFVPRSDRSRRASVEALRNIKPATSFRSGYAYDNVLYMVAGQLVEEVTGQTWEDYTVGHIFRPAGMTVSTAHRDTRYATANRAFPHARMNGGLRGAGDQERLDERDELGRNAAPAGGLALSADDMTKWLSLQLAHGRLPGGGQLFSEASAKEMWKPVVLMPNPEMPEPLKATQPMFETYALGWNVRDYRGAKIVLHGGAVFGSLTTVVLIPEKNVGFSIMINSEDAQVIRGLMYELLDHYLGLPKQDWPEKWESFWKTRLDGGLKALQAKQASPAKAGPSLPLARYAGDYADAWYGRLGIRAEKGGLRIDFRETPRMAGKLEHWQYDTFITRFDDRSIEPAYVTFSLDAEGKVERISMKAVSPLADFSYDYHDLLFRPAAK